MAVTKKSAITALVVAAILAAFGALSASAANPQFRVPADCKVRQADWRHPGGDAVVKGGVYSPSQLHSALSSTAGKRAMHCAGLSPAEQTALIKGASSATKDWILQNSYFGVMSGAHETFVSGRLTGGTLAAWKVTGVLPDGGKIIVKFAMVCSNVVPIARVAAPPPTVKKSTPAPAPAKTVTQGNPPAGCKVTVTNSPGAVVAGCGGIITADNCSQVGGNKNTLNCGPAKAAPKPSRGSIRKITLGFTGRVNFLFDIRCTNPSSYQQVRRWNNGQPIHYGIPAGAKCVVSEVPAKDWVLDHVDRAGNDWIFYNRPKKGGVVTSPAIPTSGIAGVSKCLTKASGPAVAADYAGYAGIKLPLKVTVDNGAEFDSNIAAIDCQPHILPYADGTPIPVVKGTKIKACERSDWLAGMHMQPKDGQLCRTWIVGVSGDLKFNNQVTETTQSPPTTTPPTTTTPITPQPKNPSLGVGNGPGGSVGAGGSPGSTGSGNQQCWHLNGTIGFAPADQMGNCIGG